MPQEALVGEAPGAGVFPEHVDECVHVQARRLGPDAKHHAGAKYPLRDVDLPVEPAAVELARAPNPGRAVAPVGVEVRDAVPGAAQPDLVRLLLRVPRPAVLARVGQRLNRLRLLLGFRGVRRLRFRVSVGVFLGGCGHDPRGQELRLELGNFNLVILLRIRIKARGQWPYRRAGIKPQRSNLTLESKSTTVIGLHMASVIHFMQNVPTPVPNG